MRVNLSKDFKKSLKKAPELARDNFYERVELLIKDKFNPLLNNHALYGRYEGYRSINVTGDWRAIFKECNFGDKIHFTDLGTHSQLYKK